MANPADTSNRDFATKAVAEESIRLVSATPQDAEIRGGRVPTGDGAFAWHVSDESVKARIDVARECENNGPAIWINAPGQDVTLRRVLQVSSTDQIQHAVTRVVSEGLDGLLFN